MARPLRSIAAVLGFVAAYLLLIALLHSPSAPQPAEDTRRRFSSAEVRYHPVYSGVIVGDALPTSATDPTVTATGVASAAATYAFFEDVLLIVMVSPSRVDRMPDAWQHYRRFFRHMTFCSPRAASVNGVRATGHNVARGLLQYRAVADVVGRAIGDAAVAARRAPRETAFPFAGFLFVADDLLLSPWAIAAARLNKSSTWASEMGIASLTRRRGGGRVVPGMDADNPPLTRFFPHFHPNSHRLLRVMDEGGPRYRRALRRAARATPDAVFANSNYPSAMRQWREYGAVMFYTIADAYYVPRQHAHSFVWLSRHMALHGVFGECAVPTMLRLLQPTYERLDVQYYWSTPDPDGCARSFWSATTHGIHRCRHDHAFARLIYGPDAARRRLATDRSFLDKARAMRAA